MKIKPAKITKFGDYAKWVTFEVMANFQVRVVFSDDLFKSAKARLGSIPDESADAFVYHVKDEGKSYIFLPMDASENVVVHECWHIVRRVFRWCHVADLDDEIVAYHLDHLVEKVYEFKNTIPKKESNEKPTK